METKAKMEYQVIHRRRRRLYLSLAGCALTFILLCWWIIPPVWQLRDGPIEVIRWPKSGEQLFLIGPGQEHWVSIEKVSLHVLHAIVVAEDARFYQHHGLDFREIRNSIEINLEKKAYVRGASTITQQVIKMAFLSQEKTILRKLKEAVGSLLAEYLLEKQDILEWYINLVEFGDGVFGIKEAAIHYFDTEPELLTIQQGANLALVLPSPNNWSAGLRRKQLTAFGHRRYSKIIEQMFLQGFITKTLRDSALATGDFGRPIQLDLPQEEAIQVEEPQTPPTNIETDEEALLQSTTPETQEEEAPILSSEPN
ncbi:MAG: transglycosylase domain-containing protein [Oligoflexus sp.]